MATTGGTAAAPPAPAAAIPQPPSTQRKYIKMIFHHFISNFLTILFVPLAAILVQKALRVTSDDLHDLHIILHRNPEAILLSSAFLLLFSTLYLLTRPRAIYLVDYACFRAPDELRTPYDKFAKHIDLCGLFDNSSLQFQKKILAKSGLGDDTCFPPALQLIPPKPSMEAARQEAETVMFAAIDKLFAATSTDPKDVDVLVVNSSLFNPTPSLSAMIVNRYKMRNSVRSFNLGGMGCSAGVLAVDLAKDLLQLHRNSLAVVVSTELITTSWYTGNEKSMLLPNCLFRMGGAAVLLSNRCADRRRSKYKLLRVVRTHLGAEDRAYRCVYQEQDTQGNAGVTLQKNLMDVAGDALKANMTTLGPLVLPMSEQLLFLGALIARRLLDRERVHSYVPDFKMAFEHFCIHAGGKAVIDAIERGAGLTPADVEASRMALYRFGNTSSSSVWYELAYSEAKGRVRKGDRVWQVAFGSGFKCNSAVWVALRKVKATQGSNPWLDCIDGYPVEVVDRAVANVNV